MKVYIFTIFDNFDSEAHVQNEFLDKHLILKHFFNDITFLTFNNDLSQHPIINKYEISTEHVGNVNDIPTDGDLYFTFGNFASFPLNERYYKDKYVPQPHEDIFNKYVGVYIKLNKWFNNNDLELWQYMSDPMDYIFDRAKILTPDTKIIEGSSYFPLYQYFHNSVVIEDDVDKLNKFIVGSTCYNENRYAMFDKYLLPLYVKHQSNVRYKFYVSGYSNLFFRINNFIEHNDFFNEISHSQFGMVLPTYASDIISANKISQFLSKKCIPILTNGCDSRSGLIPQELKDKYTVNDGIGLIRLLQTINYEDALNDWADFRESMNVYNSKKVINNYISKHLIKENI